MIVLDGDGDFDLNGDGEMEQPLKAPFPYFGGKSRIASTVWSALGDPKNYVEPFFGSGAVLLARPCPVVIQNRIETVNDADGFLANFWRALQHDPDAVAWWANWPVNEVDLHARHAWLVNRKERLLWSMEDPDFYDVKLAGWWVWGMSAWIGSGFCSGSGPWVSDGAHIRDRRAEPVTAIAGKGVNRTLPHLGDAGRGVNRTRPHLGNAGRGVNRKIDDLAGYFAQLKERLRNVRVCCGDWSRVCGPTPTFKNGQTGIFLDPPYSFTANRAKVYSTDDFDIARTVHEWAKANGENPLLRIVVCGYEGDTDWPEGWRTVEWTAAGGYQNQTKIKQKTGNNKKERLWLSPHCLEIGHGT